MFGPQPMSVMAGGLSALTADKTSSCALFRVGFSRRFHFHGMSVMSFFPNGSGVSDGAVHDKQLKPVCHWKHH